MLRIAAVLHATGRVAGSVRIVRAPLLVALIGAVGLAVPEQSREILRVHALDFHKQLAQVGSGFLFLTLAAFAVWRMAKNLAEIDSTRAESACIGVLAWLPLVCGMLLPVGMAGARVEEPCHCCREQNIPYPVETSQVFRAGSTHKTPRKPVSQAACCHGRQCAP